MHSSRMRTTRSSNCQGGLPQCMLGHTPPGCGPGDPPGCGPEDPPGCGPPRYEPADHPKCGPGDPSRPDPSTSPLGVGLETPQPDPSTAPPPCMWAWTPARHAGIAPRDLLQGILGYHLQCMLGYHASCEQNHRHV